MNKKNKPISIYMMATQAVTTPTLPASKFIAVVDGEERSVQSFKRFQSNRPDGNFYINNVYYNHCPLSTTRGKQGDCAEEMPYSTSADLLTNRQHNLSSVDVKKGVGILNPQIYVRHSGGSALGTVRMERTQFPNGLAIPAAISVDITVGSTTFTIAEGFGKDGRNEIVASEATASGRAFTDTGMANKFFSVGWGAEHHVTDFVTSASSPSEGIYAYDFVVASLSNDRLVYRTYLQLLEDDKTPIVLSYAPSTGYTCCI